MAAPQRHAAFVRYRHTAADREVARWLHGALESYGLPGPPVTCPDKPQAAG